ncbi:hypothetical protein PVAND_001809 [Polypedilum vanderplanki]|uniref:HIT-type domain-containing protein n=1 Tax=Polypedilum vanderplanki TaxID=319348 RepID=A0A9J6BPI1_POLVA|nr:hypothetical protein PVAND_001809 [Polypedilum vanderplanki]
MKCYLCKTQDYKYQCPRCNIKYCSLDCYRSEKHSQCSEAFYKECVMNELKNQQHSLKNKKKFIEMLQRTEEQKYEDDEWLDSDDDEDEVDLAERLNEVDLDNADEIWERLTDTEKEEFKSILFNDDKNQIEVEIDESQKRVKEIEQLLLKKAAISKSAH